MSNLTKIGVVFFCSFSLFSISHAVNVEGLSQKKKAVETQVQTKKVELNLNLANANQISKAFKGIGPKRSKAIVAYRETHGVFKSFNDLSSVKGISKRFIEKNTERLKAVFIL